MYQSASLSERMRYADTLAAAGDLIPVGLRENGKGTPPSPGKILLVMETGAMLGLNPMAALQGIDVIEGKATISPQLMTALVRAAGHTIKIEKSGTVKGGDFLLTATLTRKDDGQSFESSWNIQRALRAELVDSYSQTANGWVVSARSQYGKIRPWEAHPETMCQWRAIGDVCRVGADDVLKGIAYTREEIESEVSIAAEPEPEPTEDWGALLDAAQTAAEVNEISARIKAKNEGTEALRLKRAVRLGAIEREANVEDAEVVADDEPEDAAGSAGAADLSSGDTGGDGAEDPRGD